LVNGALSLTQSQEDLEHEIEDKEDFGKEEVGLEIRIVIDIVCMSVVLIVPVAPVPKPNS
jgi:hypothetical protein